MKKFVIPIVIGAALASGVALATPAPKVFVCKYVGTPGVNETLQIGQNPISVSSNAIQNYQGVGSWFNDAQGRSFVIAEDTGQDEPSCTAEPTPSPSPSVTPAVTPTPTPVSDCEVCESPTPTPAVTPTPTSQAEEAPTTLPGVGAKG